MPLVAERTRIEEMTSEDGEVAALLIDLALEEQEHFTHPRETREQVERRLRVAPSFTGENHLLIARDGDGHPLGVCWVVLFDPGTGLEGEIAELYVRPQARGGGVARSLVAEAMALLRRRLVTFACVWTRDSNPVALHAYRAAGFAPTEQVVLTWLPLAGGSGTVGPVGRE